MSVKRNCFQCIQFKDCPLDTSANSCSHYVYDEHKKLSIKIYEHKKLSIKIYEDQLEKFKDQIVKLICPSLAKEVEHFKKGGINRRGRSRIKQEILISLKESISDSFKDIGNENENENET